MSSPVAMLGAILIATLTGCGDGGPVDAAGASDPATPPANGRGPWFGRLDVGPDDAGNDRALDFSAVSDASAAGSASGTVFIVHHYPAGAGHTPRHRTVIFRDGRPPAEPLPTAAAGHPAQLWDWMDRLRDRGVDSLAIRHGPGGDTGTDAAAAAERRQRNEPLVAIAGLDSDTSQDAVVETLLRGIGLETQRSFNPFQTGLVSDVEARSTLTGVWAPEPSHAALFDALRRRETFVTSGSRMVLRLVAGFDLPGNADGQELPGATDAVPMGGDLLPAPGVPWFAASARQAPGGAPLARLQIVKGWVAEAGPRVRRYHIVCADGPCADAAAGAAANPCEAPPAVGAARLAVTWEDPDFHPDQEAFYYLEALATPSCPNPPARVRERAWSSPIWYHGSAR